MLEWKNKIVFNHNTCENMNGNTFPIEENSIALYVVMTRNCNVDCPFCEYHNSKSALDLELFKQIFLELLTICNITTVHFTGGEPTLEIEKLYNICKFIKDTDKNITTSVNTNGTNLSLLSNFVYLDNIALSRHHYNDNKNQIVFNNSKVPSAKEISKFQDIQKVHLSCNLIKGYIDSKEEVQKYLDFASEIGVNDIGLVSLMNINKFCDNHFVDFDTINIESIERLKKTKCFCKKEKNIPICRCDNYLYQTKNNSLVSVYHRYAINNNSIADYLVYDNNSLRQGFTCNLIFNGR